jgi:solute carrier family 35 (adenosine 3'-phospho 5'-phosphosulfate transporter), member B3
MQFLISSFGVLFCYSVYMVFLEAFMSKAKMEPGNELSGIGWFVTFIQFLIYSIFMYLQRKFDGYNNNANNNPQHPTPVLPTFSSSSSSSSSSLATVPLIKFAVLGTLSVGTIGLANVACFHLSIPVMQVFKSAKILPVMLMGTFILKKTYTCTHYISALLISLGLMIFVISNAKVTPTFSMLGILLVCGSLTCDAIIGNFQEKLFRDYKQLMISESLMKSKIFGSISAFVICVITGNLMPSVLFCYKYFYTVSLWIVCFAIIGVIGENFIMVLVKLFGAVVTVTTTTVRKGISLFLSFILFPKTFSIGYLIGGIIMLIGVIINIVEKNPTYCKGNKLAQCDTCRRSSSKPRRRRMQFSPNRSSQSVLPVVV